MSALPGALGTSLKAIYRGTRDEKPSEDFTVEGKKGTLVALKIQLKTRDKYSSAKNNGVLKEHYSRCNDKGKKEKCFNEKCLRVWHAEKCVVTGIQPH